MPKMLDKLSQNHTRIALLAIVIILIPFGYSFVTAVFAQGGDTTRPFLQRPDAKHEKCVRDTEYMRYHHWELLKEIRDEVVREGKTWDFGLDNCWECHTNREHFCDQCHNAANVQLLCFRCHHDPDAPAGEVRKQ
jgi:hypothetical protein